MTDAADARDGLVRVAFSVRGATKELSLPSSVTLGELGAQIEEQTGIAASTMKLLVGGRALLPGEQAHLTLASAGLQSHTHRLHKILVIGSTSAEICEAAHASRDDPLLAPMDVDDRRARRRRRRQRSALPLPTGPYVFAEFRVLEAPPGLALRPSSQKAMALLHRLASDPGIAGVMQARRWRVGLMSEMPPEGKVGVSESCVLGYNVNHGQEISLRLRTDDWQGFRRYARIRETLIHELAHMVFSEHDTRFKMLNSELTVQAANLDWTHGAGRRADGSGGAAERRESSSDDGGSSEEEEGGGGNTAARRGGQRVGGAADASARNAAAAAGAAAQRRAAAAAEAAMEAEAEAALARPGAPGAAQPHAASDAAGGAACEQQCTCGRCSFLSSAPNSLPGLGAGDGGGGRLRQIDDAAAQLAEATETVEATRVEAESEAAGAGSGAEAAGETCETSPPVLQSELQQLELQRSAGAGANTTEVSRPSAAGSVDTPPADTVTAAAPDEAADMAVDDPELARVFALAAAARAKAERAVADLQAAAGSEAPSALSTLEKLLRNALESADPKFRSIRRDNAVFAQRVGRFAPAVALLRVAGFAEESAAGAMASQQQQQQQQGGGVLRLRRDDPALLWLALSAVTQALEAH